MGRQYIEGFMDQDISLDQLLTIHLQGNHYPPVSVEFVPVCKEVIDHCNNEEYDHVITMPNGIKKTAYDIVEGLHLDTFLDPEDEY